MFVACSVLPSSLRVEFVFVLVFAFLPVWVCLFCLFCLLSLCGLALFALFDLFGE